MTKRSSDSPRAELRVSIQNSTICNSKQPLRAPIDPLKTKGLDTEALQYREVVKELQRDTKTRICLKLRL